MIEAQTRTWQSDAYNRERCIRVQAYWRVDFECVCAFDHEVCRERAVLVLVWRWSELHRHRLDRDYMYAAQWALRIMYCI